MAWTGLTLTTGGRDALNQAQVSNYMNIKSIVVGDGLPLANFTTLKGLVHQLYEITELRVDMTKEGCTLTADFPQVDYDYYFRELGVVITTDEGDVLYVYDNSGDDAQYIINSTGAETLQKRLRLSLIISDVANIELSTPSNLYVDYKDFESTVTNLKNDIEMKASQENFDEHAGDTIRHITADEREKWNSSLNSAKEYSDETYQQATGYTDLKISQLINGAPETLDTLKEVADAIEENENVVDALDAAIGTKASQAEFDTHSGNSTIHITAAERTNWNSKANGSHTHSYAGSSSAGGAANSAVKLQTPRTITIGNQSQPFDGSKNIVFDEKSMGLLKIARLQGVSSSSTYGAEFARIKCKGQRFVSSYETVTPKDFFMIVNHAYGNMGGYYMPSSGIVVSGMTPTSIGGSGCVLYLRATLSDDNVTITLCSTTTIPVTVLYDAAKVEVIQL